ncbi:MAG: TetR/AcrR family transcriptional regulator [Endozoicomonas sp.]
MSDNDKSASTLDSILNAAKRCYDSHGLDGTSLDQVALEAGVGRTTVYRHVKNRKELLNLVLMRDARDGLSELKTFLRYWQSLEQKVLESIVFLLRRRGKYNMQHILYGHEAGIRQVTGLSYETLRLFAAEALQEHFQEASAANEIPEQLTFPVLADWLSRLIMSLLSQPSEFTRTEESLRQYLQVILAPVFRRQ